LAKREVLPIKETISFVGNFGLTYRFFRCLACQMPAARWGWASGIYFYNIFNYVCNIKLSKKLGRLPINLAFYFLAIRMEARV
jgi:hypothetical protein